MVVPALDEVERDVARSLAADPHVDVVPRHTRLLVPVDTAVVSS